MNATRRDVLCMASGLAATTVVSSILAFEALAARRHADGDRLPAFMTAHFKPVMDETTAFALPVRGVIPSALSGSYVRTGHNPKDGINPDAWFYGSGTADRVTPRCSAAARKLLASATARKTEMPVRSMAVGYSSLPPWAALGEFSAGSTVSRCGAVDRRGATR